MKKILLLFLLPVLACSGCAADEPRSAVQGTNILNGDTKTLVAYFSAQGTTKGVAEAIQKATDYSLHGMPLASVSESGVYVRDGKKYLAH